MELTDQKKDRSERTGSVQEFLITHSFSPLIGGLEAYWQTVISRSGRSFGVLTNPLPPHVAEVSFPNLQTVLRQKLWAWPIPPSWLPWWWRLPRLVNRLQPLRIHLGHYSALATVVRKRVPHIPVYLYLHGADVAGALQRPSWTEGFKATLQHARRVICNSNYLAQLVSEKTGVERDQLSVVHPGIETQQFVADAATSNAFLQKHTLEPKKYFVTISRLIPQKGIDTVISAFAQSGLAAEGFRYCICGDGPDRSRLEHRARSAGVGDAVVFAGTVPPDPITKASIFDPAVAAVLTTHATSAVAESFGIVALEAQASGIPIVVSTAGGTTETVAPNLHQLIVPPDNDAALSVVLQLLAAKPETTTALGHTAQQYVREHFDSGTMVEQLTRIWDER